MKTFAFLFVVCALACVTYAIPVSSVQSRSDKYNQLQMQNLLDELAERQQSVPNDPSSALVQVIDRAAMESLTEKARIQFWGALARHALGLLG